MLLTLLELSFRFLDRLVNTLEEKRHHEVKLREGLKDIATKRMELQNSLSSLWPKQVLFLDVKHGFPIFFVPFLSFPS